MEREGKITKYKVNKNGDVELIIKLSQDKNLIKNLTKYRSCDIILKNKDTITSQQRKKIYALIGDIAKFTGDDVFNIKQMMKFYYVQQGGSEISISDCTKEEAKELINVIMDFALENMIPLGKKGLEITEDILHYLYKCCEFKRCCISGTSGKIYNVDSIGEVDKSEHTKICLSDKYYEELERIGKDKFFKKYCVCGVKYQEKKNKKEE